MATTSINTATTNTFDLNIQITTNDDDVKTKNHNNKLSWNERRRKKQQNHVTTNKKYQRLHKKPSTNTNKKKKKIATILTKKQISLLSSNQDIRNNSKPSNKNEQQHDDDDDQNVEDVDENDNHNNDEDKVNDINNNTNNDKNFNGTTSGSTKIMNNSSKDDRDTIMKDLKPVIPTDNRKKTRNINDNSNQHDGQDKKGTMAYYNEFHARPYELDQKATSVAVEAIAKIPETDTKRIATTATNNNKEDDDDDKHVITDADRNQTTATLDASVSTKPNKYSAIKRQKTKVIPIQKLLLSSSSNDRRKINNKKYSGSSEHHADDNTRMNEEQPGDDVVCNQNPDRNHWDQFQSYLHPTMLQMISKKYHQPTTIQANMIHAFFTNHKQQPQKQKRRRRDIIIQSETGSGKTFSYLLPILQSIIYENPIENHDDNDDHIDTDDDNKHGHDDPKIITKDRQQLGTRMIIICPTRELVLQTMSTIQYIIQQCHYYWIIVYCLIPGYEKRSSEKAKLRKGVTIVVATPGRLLDHLLRTQSLYTHCFGSTSSSNSRGGGANKNDTSTTTIATNQRINLRYVIFDEADRYFDDSSNSRTVNEQVRQIIQILQKPTSSSSAYPFWNCVLVSATITSRIIQLANEMIFSNDSNTSENHRQINKKKDHPWIMVHGRSSNSPGPTPSSNSKQKNHDNDLTMIPTSDHHEISNSNIYRDDEKTITNYNDDDCNLNKLQQINDETIIMPTPTTTAMTTSSSSVLPHQLQHYHVLVSAKLRLPTLIGFLLDRIVTISSNNTKTTGSNNQNTTSISPTTAMDTKTMKQPPKRTVIFVSTCAAVDYYYSLFTNATPIWNHNNDKNNNSSNNNSSNSNSSNNNSSNNNSSNTEKGVFGPLCTFYKLHGNMPHEDRSSVMNQFLNLDHRNNKTTNRDQNHNQEDPDHQKSDSHMIGVLFTTDVTARGLNLSDIDWIIQYDPPSEITDYIHRAGRVARAGNIGYCLLFLLPSEREYLDILIQQYNIPSSIKQYPISLTSILNTAAIILQEMKQMILPVQSSNAININKQQYNIQEMISTISKKKNHVPTKSSRSGEEFCFQIQNQLEETVLSDSKNNPNNNKHNKNNSDDNNKHNDNKQNRNDKHDKKRRDGNDNNNNNDGNDENDNKNLLQMARNAFLSHIRAYPTKEKSIKHIFTTKSLHLGHVAKSFALRDPPKKVGSSYHNNTNHDHKKSSTSKSKTQSNDSNNKKKNKKRHANNNNDDHIDDNEASYKRRKVERMKFNHGSGSSSEKGGGAPVNRKQLLMTNAMKLQSMAGMDG